MGKLNKVLLFEVVEDHEVPSTTRDWIKILNNYVVRTDAMVAYQRVKLLGEGAYA